MPAFILVIRAEPSTRRAGSMRTRTVTYSSRSWQVRFPVLRLFGRGYFCRLRWPVRILAWLITAGIASLAGWQYAIIGPVAFEVAFLDFCPC